VTALHQLLPSYAKRDAIGSHALRIQALLRNAGYESEVYARWRDDPPGPCHGLTSLRPRPGERTVLLYHLSTGSEVAALVAARSEPLIVDYHNISPNDVFGRWEPTIGPELALGRRQLVELAGRATLAVADSSYNASECRSAGYRRAQVAPFLLDVDELLAEVDQLHLRRLGEERASRGGVDWLFVGRVAPHKAQHDLVKAFAAYRRAYDPHARLTLIGGSSSHAYLTALEAFVDTLGLRGAVRLRGSVSSGELAAHYATADLFVGLSEHEGFCVPLLESMASGLPVVAYAAAAVPETLGGAGLLLLKKDPATVAAACHRVATDEALRKRFVAAGRAQLARFALGRTEAVMYEALRPVLEG
jgi:glycosyltransferase involved in cell wall biosynthesis